MDGWICISDLVFGEQNEIFPPMLRGFVYRGLVMIMDMVGV